MIWLVSMSLDTAIQIMLVILINIDQLLVMCLLLKKHQLVGSLLYSRQWLCLRRRQSIWRSLKYTTRKKVIVDIWYLDLCKYMSILSI